MTDTTLFESTENASFREYTPEEVQLLLIKHLCHLVDYWVKQDESLKDNLEGFTHSMWVTLNGFSLGFGGACYMSAYSTPEQIIKAKESNSNFFPEGEANGREINSDLLQSRFSIAPDEVVLGSAPRRWKKKEATTLFRHEVANRINNALELKRASDREKGYYFLRSLLELFENGFSDGLGNIQLVAWNDKETQGYSIDNEENYFPLKAPISGIDKSLLTAYDEFKLISGN